MRAVISFADTPFYQEKMKRLRDSVEAQGIKFIGYTSCEQVGCKPHSEIPYAFKPYAIWKAIQEGVTTVLWCDSCIVAFKDINPVFDYIEKHGFMFFNNHGHTLGMWTNDKALNHFGITREDAMSIKMTMQCCFGLSAKNQQASDFFFKYQNLAYDLYPGSSSNHRHDQSTASLIINEMGLEMINGHSTFFIYTHFKDVFKISDSVCLESR